MSFLNKLWRVPALALVVALPILAACADDEGAGPPLQGPDVTGSISGTVTSSLGGPIVGALVGTSPATATALTDASGNYRINNVPIPTNPTSYAVTASKEGFNSASGTTSLSSTSPTGTVNLTLTPAGPGTPTEGNLNVLVTNRNGEPQSGAAVAVINSAGVDVAGGTTDATGFALFSNLPVDSYLVFAEKSISGFNFRASGGVNVRGGETAFIQLTLTRDFGQSVFPNIDGEPVILDEDADIRFVPVPGSPDSNPLIDCNVIRTQHMFIAEVVDDGLARTPNQVSGVKVQWDLNISTVGICNLIPFQVFRCEDFIPGNTGSIVDSDDPDLDPATARSGLTPAFNVDTRKAVTFTNDNDQVVQFNGQSVVVGAGQTWIIITSPVEGITDVIAFTPDIPVFDADCANSAPRTCDKEFAIKRWVNWDTRVAELDWDGNAGDPNLASDPPAVFNDIDDGDTVVNVLSRADDLCTPIIGNNVPGACELTGNTRLFYADVTRLRTDSPFQFRLGVIKFDILDDNPAVELFGEDGTSGAGIGVQNVANRGFFPPQAFDGCELAAKFNGLDPLLADSPVLCDDGYGVDKTPGAAFRDHAEGEFFSPNEVAGPIFADAPGWVVFELRLDPLVYFCVDVDGDTDCEPGDLGSTDSFSTAYQRLLDGLADNTNTFEVSWCDEFGEDCDDLTFDKDWVSSRIRVIKTTPDAVVRTVSETVGGPGIANGSTPRPVKTHTIQVGQQFSYTITVINDGEVRSENVRITDTLPRFGFQFDEIDPDDGEPTMRDGNQAFAYVTDRPTFDPIAVVYGVDEDDNDNGNDIDFCIRGDDGSVTGNAYVVPPQCTAPDGTTPGPIVDAGTVGSARTVAESESEDGEQIVWIQWFDESILGRQSPGGGIETEDTVEVTLIADEDFIDFDGAGPGTGYPALPGTWCDIATVTDGPDNLLGTETESFDADTLCHEVREALLEVRKTTQDAVISAGAAAEFEVEIANNGSATLTNTVIVDTLDQALFDASQAEGGVLEVTIDEDFIDDFGEPTVSFNGRIFTVDIGDLPPTVGFVTVYNVMVTTPGAEGVFCNRVTASGDTPAGTLTDQDIACVTTTITIELDVENEDGEIDAGGVFQTAKEVFVVGDGSGGSTDLRLVYRVDVTNQSAFSATGVTVVDEVAPSTAAIECRGILATAPGGGANPNIGAVAGGNCSPSGFTWNIGALAGGQTATIFFRAQALAPQSAAGNRVNLTADQLTGTIVEDEPTTVTAN